MGLEPTAEDRVKFADHMAAIERKNTQRLLYDIYPARDRPQPDGAVIHARRKYARHLEFFEAGAKYRERCFMAANRVGKTFGAGGYETTCHLTGDYPHWWGGRRFDQPPEAWRTLIVSTRSLTPCFHVTEPSASPGMTPVPSKCFRPSRWAIEPSRVACTMSRVVSLVLPAAHHLTGFSNRRPFH